MRGSAAAASMSRMFFVRRARRIRFLLEWDRISIEGRLVDARPSSRYARLRCLAMDGFVERQAPIIFMVIGLLMVVAAAFADMADGLAVTFAILGVGLIALGGLVRVLEGAIELGPQGFKGQIARRGAEVIALAEKVNPKAAEPIREVVRYIDPEMLTSRRFRQWRSEAAADPALFGAIQTYLASGSADLPAVSWDDLNKNLRMLTIEPPDEDEPPDEEGAAAPG